MACCFHSNPCKTDVASFHEVNKKSTTRLCSINRLTTLHSHYYPTWNFTNTHIPNNFPLMCKSLPLYGLWQSPICSPLSYGLPPLPTCHPWAFCMPFVETTCQPCTLIHENQPPHSCPFESCASPWYSTIGNTPLLDLSPRSFVMSLHK